MPNPVINRRAVLGGIPGGLTMRTLNWVSRVIKNGGAMPSTNTILAVNAWCVGLINTGLEPLIIESNLFVPDNFIAATTPVHAQPSANDPWTNHNFLAADLTVNGLIGNGSSKYLDTGCVPSVVIPSAANFGISYYIHTSSADNGSDTGSDNGGHISMYGDFANLVIAQMTNNTSDSISWSQALWQGFVSCSKTSATQIDLYTANSSTAFAKVATTSSGVNGTLPPSPLFAFAIDNTGVAAGFSSKRLSAMVYHLGLTQAQTQLLYGITQQVRQSFGGGR